MEAIGVKVKIVEPGVINTDFGTRSLDYSNDESLEEYQGIVQAFARGGSGMQSSEPSVVAEVIYEAATDGTDKLRYPAGDDAHQLISNREAADDITFVAVPVERAEARSSGEGRASLYGCVTATSRRLR
jgi:hypothetical protein